MKTTYAVIGAGNGGQAMAAQLSMLGCSVSLYDIDAAKIKALQEKKIFEVSGKLEGTAEIDLITGDIGKAIENRDVIMVTTTTDSHAAVAEELIPFIKATQLVFLCPGHTGGTILMRNAFLAAGKDVTVAETQDLVYACRATKPGVIMISALKPRMATAVSPSGDWEKVQNLLGAEFPELIHTPSVLHTGFGNTGAMLHPAPMLLNAARVDAKESFLYYVDGITPSVAAVVEKMDEERVAVAAAYGIEVPTLTQWLQSTYGVSGANLYEMLQNNQAYAAIKAGTELNSRFITEDVPSGLVPLAAFGKLAGVATPVTDSVIMLADAVLNRQFMEEGRNLKCLGLEQRSVTDIKKEFLG